MTVDQPTQTTEAESDDQIPSALVVGGGVAGMQAALDIANQGFKVHLVEKTSSIGGRMAAIDKTFPTLDCSACILTPRLSEVARHPNIELLTYSEVKRVTGRAGNFHVEVHRRPRYVLEDKCSGCGKREGGANGAGAGYGGANHTGHRPPPGDGPARRSHSRS